MEEEKAVAYYDELTRKGEGAARFKQGLGFSSSSHSNSKPITTQTQGLGFTNFVRASNPERAAEIQKQTQIENIQNKLKKKPDFDFGHGNRSSSIKEDASRRGREDEEKEVDRRRSRRMSSSWKDDSDSTRRRRRRSSNSSEDEQRPSHRRGRSRSSEKSLRREGKGERTTSGIDYSRLIEGYAGMTPAERVKAKMKLQLSQTVEKDTAKGMGTGWERFDFNREAPLDDEEIEVADDDAVLVKDMGQSFRFSAVEAKREAEIKAAHDQAMFGAPAALPIDIGKESSEDKDVKVKNENAPGRNLISNKVLAIQQGSWRDRARKLNDG